MNCTTLPRCSRLAACALATVMLVACGGKSQGRTRDWGEASVSIENAKLHARTMKLAEELQNTFYSFVTALAVDARQMLWIGTNAQYVARLDLDNGHIRRFDPPSTAGTAGNQVLDSDFYANRGSGLAVQFGLQAMINMAVNVQIAPSKGMTLPFISYGGSSMLALSIGMGLLLAFTRRNPYLTRSPYVVKWSGESLTA